MNYVYVVNPLSIQKKTISWIDKWSKPWFIQTSMVKQGKNIWVILIHGYDSRNAAIVDGSKEKHGYNEEVSCIIENHYTFHDVNDTFLLYGWWPFLLPQNGVRDVIPIVKEMELVC